MEGNKERKMNLIAIKKIVMKYATKRIVRFFFDLCFSRLYKK